MVRRPAHVCAHDGDSVTAIPYALHLLVLSPDRITDASDVLPVRNCRHQAGAAAVPSEHRTSMRRCAAQSHFLAHCAAQAHLSSRPFRVPLLPARKPNAAIGSPALAAAPVTAAIRLFAFHRHTVSVFGPPLAMAPPDAQRPRQVQTKPSIHVRVSAPTCPRDRGRAPTRGGPYV